MSADLRPDPPSRDPAAEAAATDPVTLDLAGHLPRGTTVLEASAGTGKTYAIAALVTRAVAEGVCELPHILVVTFTRAATAELRDRIRRRLVDAASHLAGAIAEVRAGGSVAASDDVVHHALTVGATLEQLEARHRNLVDATREFDAATISTIHGFTQQVLRSVGLSVELPRSIELLEDPAELIEQVVQDVTVRRFFDRDPTDPSAPARPGGPALHALATAAITRPEARVVPRPDDPDPGAAELGQLAAEVRAEAAARKARRGVLGYDDLLLALRDALTDPVQGPLAVATLRDRYRWALVDEFQDTDPIQWDILERAFTDPDDPTRALVLIGDPKQAIYSFRGADVATYLRATDAADDRRTLGTNWRTDAALLRALEPVLAGTHFGDRRIRFRTVEAAPTDDTGPTLHDDQRPEPLQLRVVGEVPGGSGAPAVRQHIACDVASVVVHHLREVRVGRDRHRLRSRQLAVLVRTNAEAAQVQRALHAVEVPSVVNGVGSVLSTDAAGDWRWLLDALERPADQARARRYAVSAWGGWTAADLATDDERRWDHLHDQLHRWASVLREHGVATLQRTVIAETGVAHRLLATVGGERRLTDLRHVGQLLHAAELHDERGVTALRSWLLARRSDADDGTLPPEEEARRLESDDEAVQILTVHRSKGLEFDVVLAPFLFSPGQSPSVPLLLNDPDGDGRLIDAGPKGRDGLDAHQELATIEAAGEGLRLAYVALTRAKHRAVVWWAKLQGSERSALARLLFRDEDGAVVLTGGVTLPPDDAVVPVLRARLDGVDARVDPVPATIDVDPWADDRDEDAPTLAVRRFERTLDRAWHRTSYTGIVRRAAQFAGGHLDAPAGVRSEAAVTVKDDEPEGADVTTTGSAAGAAAPPAAEVAALQARDVPLGGIRGSAAFGTLVHAVLEHVDFAADDLHTALTATVAEQVRQHDVTVDPAVLVDGLVAAVTSPLGPLAGTVSDDAGTRWRRLADLSRSERLDEMTFELPLAGGDRGRRGGTPVALARLADLLERDPDAGGLAADDPLRAAGYAARLRAPGYHLDLRGYLNGAIDLTFRVPDGDGHRYLVADHKTNRLAWPDPPTAWDHRPSALATAMVEHDYPLQALLYQVALHRYLAWRLPDYEPDRHLGGTLYLFLRGMIGPDTPMVDGSPIGVFAWRPPARLITDLSDLLDGAEVSP
ncbi:UvrD-helicase domain-containing protein [Nitriliruptor alkaliphilus]|uniref:UvrD-helicase domain-containing protein n=1 Tax=Nitriliruptor alkaliphilus TaxID=427918 RepID=UPI0006982568|nr:UvrD-helicase domain-containing protein [Nitriliruptor alkaliphilus]